MTNEILEGNKLIAEFMSTEKRSIWYHMPDINNWKGYSEKEVLFHSSWEWLMPVVEKIEAAKYVVEIRGCKCSVLDNGNSIFDNVYGKDKINATWLAVIRFIRLKQNRNQQVSTND